ncbi:hypothetical protein [Acidiplasma sp. MBA-1]|nr:hypothetical protein [Acidiplasma sp. MBA-1]KJE48810.1 hypothetical protein TZ01_05840 [Acidiplasma sp. MBA-1]
MIIILFREFGRYIAFKRSGMHYSFPIMVPSLGIGTLGFINTSRDQYKTGKSMLFSGFLSILFGFISSIIIIILGFFYEPSVLIYHNIDYMPVNRLDLPLMSTFFLNKIIPAASLKPPMEFAGYSGLISTALNALPLGFLDGGLVSSAISGKNQIYLSIVSIIILLTLSFIFPFILILLIISVIIGIRGPAPLNNLIKIPKKAMITAATIVTSILIFTMVPAGIQVNHNGGITVNMPSYVIVNKNWHENATLKVSIVNHGAGRITPQFYIDNLSMVVNNGPMYINPGGSGTYNISIMTYNTNLSGYKDYKMLIYTGMQTYNGTLKVYYIKSTPTMVSGNYSNTSSGTVVIGAMVGSNITLKISNNLNYTMNLQAVSISNGMDIFKLTNSHIWENITASSNIFGNGIMLPPDHSINITFRALTPGTWIILFYSNNTSTLVIINVHAVHKRFTFSFFLLFHQQIQNILQAQYAHDLQGPWGAYSQ